MRLKGILLSAILCLLAACDASQDAPTGSTSKTAPESSGSPASATIDAKTAESAPVSKTQDIAQTAERYAGRALTVVDASEIQLDGASTLSVTFSVPLQREQAFHQYLHLADKTAGPVDGAWELSDNQMELRLRHLQPKRELTLTIDAGLKAINGNALNAPYTTSLNTRNITPSVGFASRGSLLPTRLAEGLPVIALNVDKINVDFFRIKPDALPAFLARWGNRATMGYWESSEILPMAELVYTGRFNLSPKLNTRETVLLPLTGIEPLKESGVYLAVMQQAGKYDYQQSTTLLTLSDIGLSAHRYRDRIDVFTQALNGGQPLGKIAIRVLGKDSAVLAETQTDAQGHAQLTVNGNARVLLAQHDGQTSLLRLDNPALDLAEYKIDGPRQQPQQFFVFGPRDLYRPGETVLLNALLRDGDGHALPPHPVPVEVRRPDNQTSRRFVWKPDANGLYQYELQLGEEAPTGRWQLVMQVDGATPQLYEFSVEDFLPERMALELKGEDAPLAPDEPFEVNVTGRYLYGAPANGNTLSSQLYVRPLREAVATLPGYQFGSITEADLSQDLDLDDLTLDTKGRGLLSQDTRWSEARSPLQLILQSSLQESGGRPVTRRLVQPVWPAQHLPGIRPLFNDGEVDADSQAGFEIVMANAQGKKLQASQLRVRLVRERRDYYWGFSDDEGWSSRYNEKAITMSEEMIDIAANGSAKVSFPVEWGPYRVEVEDPETDLVSSIRFWAGYRWQDNTDNGSVRPDQVKLSLDRPAYPAGDQARITVTPPTAGNGYLLVESAEGPLWWQPIEVPEGSKTFDVPVAKDWSRHDLYVTALVIRPGEAKTGVTPKRAVGLLHLPLDREARRLNLTVNTPARMEPGQPLKVRLQARNADGSIPQQAHVLVSAVDTGVLSITRYTTPDPFSAFFGRKAYTADQFDVYGQLIEAGRGRLAALAFGGDADLSAGGKRPPTKVKILSEQSQAVTFDAEGNAEVSLPVEDFNGELRVMAQAWTEDRFGAGESKVTVAAPLVAELAAPRFLASGDETTLALDVTNLSGRAQQLIVKTEVLGRLALQETVDKPLALKEGQRVTLKVPVKALGGYGTGKVTVRITGLVMPEGSSSLSRDWTLGVRPAYPARRDQFSVALDASTPSWSLPASVLEAYAPETREAMLAVSSQPPLNLAEHIKALEAYPYGCLEQTTSGLYPSLYADAESLKRLGIQGEQESDRRRKIEVGIDRLLGMQRYSGGFGLWSAESSEEYWLTAYVTDFLLRARERGFTVPAEPLNKATQRLLRYLQDPNQIDVGYSENATHDRFAVQAYAAYVLARSKQAPLGALRSLFDRREGAASGLPLVHLAIALQRMGDNDRAMQALTAGLAQVRASKAWFHDYGSVLRDEAQILALLEENDLAANQRTQRLFALAEELSTHRWLSTQERNWLYLAGRSVMSKPAQPWKVELTLAGAPRELADNRDVTQHIDGAELNTPLSVRNTGDAVVYQQMIVNGYGMQAPAPTSENLSIERSYLGMDGRPVNLSQLHSGELVLVHLAVRAHQRVPDALVVDLLPAGLELENQNLAQSAASLEDAGSNVREWVKAMQNGTLKHQEYRDDRYVAAVDVNGYSTTHLVYLARAVTPGRYLVPPPQVESMYRPAWQALGATPDQLVVLPR